MSRGISFTLLFTYLAGLAAGHASVWHPSMWGFNVTQQTFPYDNRPVAPLMAMSFDQWWFHGHLDHPPHAEDVYQLPAGQPATFEIACTKSATSYFASSGGGDIQNGEDPCPGSPPSEYHTTGIDDVKGCSLAIAYKSDVSQVQPEDFTIFSVNHTCVWNRFTDFQVPERMPPCPPGGCICAFFWIHSPDSGSEQNYMNGFQCNVTGSTSDVALATPQVPRRCGADPANGKLEASLGNCTYGAKQPFYWFQKENNNMFEGTYSPPFYTDLYNFKDGAQNDIFQDSYLTIPPPSPNASLPVLNSNAGSTGSTASRGSTSSGAPSSSASATATSSQVSSATSTTGSASSAPVTSPSSTGTSTATVLVTRTVFASSTGSSLSTSSSTETALATSKVLVTPSTSASAKVSSSSSSLTPSLTHTSASACRAKLSSSASVSASFPISSSLTTIYLNRPSSSSSSLSSALPSPSSSSVERITLSLSPSATSQSVPPKQLEQSGSSPSATASSSSRKCKHRPGGNLRKRSRFYSPDTRRLTRKDLWWPL